MLCIGPSGGTLFMRASHYLVPTLVLLGCTPTAGIGGNAFLDVVPGDQVAVDAATPVDATPTTASLPPRTFRILPTW
jgi:hypothetical protein